MANTRGFEVVAELREAALKELLLAAWKSGGDASEEGVIPEKIDIPGPSFPGPLVFGPLNIKKGHVQIPQEQLDLKMDTGVNGFNIKLGTLVHIEIENPPIDSAKLFDITADATIRTPLGARNNNEIIADFTNLPANAVTIAITSGDPIAPLMANAVSEFVHKKYQDNTIPHVIDPIPVALPLGNIAMKCRVEFYDDANQAGKSIVVTQPNPAKVKVSIPCYLKFYEITGSYFGFSLLGPMGVNAIAEMEADYTNINNTITAKLSTAAVTLTNITPAAGVEGNNYTTNKNLAGLVGINVDDLITKGFTVGAVQALKNIGDIVVAIPTLQQIEAFAADVVKKELERRKQIQIWQVEEVDGTQTTINDVFPKALPDCIAICINNSGSGNPGALVNFIPANRDFGIGTSVAKVRNAFLSERDKRYPELKKGKPHTFSQKIEGKTVRLNRLDLQLKNGHIEINGDVTIVDAVAGSIDVDAGFSQKVKLKWDPSGSSPQEIKHELDGDPDVSMGAAAWILAALIGFLTLGVVGLIIGLIIVAVVESIASQIGGQVAKDESGKLSSLGAWPGTIDKIGNVKASFFNPVGISPDGLLFAGEMVITSKHALTSLDMARSNGPYITSGNQPIQFNGGAAKQTSQAKWQLGDGSQNMQRSPVHRYGKSGLYVANIQVKVNETGGVTTEHYTKVEVKNVPPKVWFEQFDLKINEGEKLDLTVNFTDDNWLDTHTVWFDFGDNTARKEATVMQSNEEPQASGKATVSHTWCDNGNFTVTAFVHDSAGGIGEAAVNVYVENVPPRIIAPRKICVLRNQPVQLEAIFADPGWCDTYVAQWETGDGYSKMATIKELRFTEFELGFASITHVYTCVGDYVAAVKVTDDDGGSDEKQILVSVTELKNADFENGYRWLVPNEKYMGEVKSGYKVANEWYPFMHPIRQYAANNIRGYDEAGTTEYLAPSAVGFDADEFIYRNGQRSQVVKLQSPGIAGIYQTVCANPGWDYEFNTYYHLPATTPDVVLWIGIDPLGGTLADSPDVIWIQANPTFEWLHAAVRVTAKANRITCFVGLMTKQAGANLFIDKTTLYMIQPIYARPKTKPIEKEDCCPVDNIDKHDFDRLKEKMKEGKNEEMVIKNGYAAQAPTVRFSQSNQAGSQAPSAIRLLTNNTPGIMLTLIEGATVIGGNVIKQTLKSGMGGLGSLLGGRKKDNG